MKNATIVTASEMGEYVYCKRAWWLRFNGKLGSTPFMQDGIEKHDSMVLFLTSLHTRKYAARIIIVLGLLILLFALVVFFLKQL